MNRYWSLLLALVFSLVMVGPAAAMPKVAEDESSPVTSGVDAPRPKKAKATNSNPVEKKKARKATTGHKAKHGKTRDR